MKKFKVIIDTDPGVDDANALIYVLQDPQFDIKLFTIANGNIPIDNAVRNMCHILDIFHKDIPVVKGYENRLSSSTEDATFLHTKEGLGGYIPPKKTIHKPLNVDAADAIYEVLKKNPKQITFCILGPHTTFAHLMMKHPDAKDLIKDILMMGGAPMGIKTNPNHNSFNIRTDSPAFKYTVDSNLPTIMVPSSIGRDYAHFTEQQVEKLKNTNDVGRFLAKTFETYWEPNYPDKRIATNDISAMYYLTYPKLFKMKRAFIDLDIKTGRTKAVFNRKGNFKIAVGLKREKFMKMLFEKLEKMNNIKIPELDNQKAVAKAKSWKTDHSKNHGIAPSEEEKPAKKSTSKKTTAKKSTSSGATKTTAKKSQTKKTTSKKN